MQPRVCGLNHKITAYAMNACTYYIKNTTYMWCEVDRLDIGAVFLQPVIQHGSGFCGIIIGDPDTLGIPL